MRALTYGLTDVGCKRDHNEDAFHVDEDLGLHIVCDGMGGALAGEVASKRCIEIVHDVVRQNAHEIQRFDATPTAEGRRALCHLLDDAIQAANTEIYAMSAKDPNQRGMGTTIVALILAGENALIAHVGDSRIYLFRRDEIHQITEDHSLVAEQVRRGLISPEEAERSPLSNVIMRAVGTREITQVDTLHLELMPGDRFLLCSDGLSGPVSAPDIGNVLETQGDPRVAAEELIQRANAGGGPDNVTAVCLFIPQDTPSQAKIPVALKVDALEQIPLFAHMTYKELMLILDVISERTYNAQEVIIQEGAVEDEFFVLLQGRAAVTKTQRPLAKLES
ncbi:MAG: Stp1/IreP family PP2C-type Ser/Thr phosphatase, partial [Deltaproteobacteria bacterium]|nr:Stp1/IreP family PP2C-type Ser/Thr phosphatase [Deltaproteobacteria bacterium]